MQRQIIWKLKTKKVPAPIDPITISGWNEIEKYSGRVSGVRKGMRVGNPREFACLSVLPRFGRRFLPEFQIVVTPGKKVTATAAGKKRKRKTDGMANRQMEEEQRGRDSRLSMA